jgi:hypothetical protein
MMASVTGLGGYQQRENMKTAGEDTEKRNKEISTTTNHRTGVLTS